MNNDLSMDFRFLVNKKAYLEKCFMAFGIKELLKIKEIAKKLEIPNYETMPAVDVLYEIAIRLSLLEVEIVSPEYIMHKIDEYLASN